MSNPEVGQAFVRLRLDPADFESEIKETVESGAEQAQAVLDDQVEKQAQAITDLRSRSESANLRSLTAELRGDAGVAQMEALSSGLLNIQANIAQAQFAAVQTLEAAAATSGVQREELLATAAVYEQAAQTLQDQLDRSKEAGKIVDPNIPGQESGVLDKLQQFGQAGGSRGGLGVLLGQGAKLGAIGLAATAAFQAFGELQQSLRVTGDEAFEFEGKIRNAGAELLSGNIIGGIKALTASRPVEIFGQLGDKLAEAKQKADPFVLTQEKLGLQFQENPEKLRAYLEVLEEGGQLAGFTAEEMFKVVAANEAIAASAAVAARAVGDVNRAIEESGSEAARFGERGNEFGRGASAIAQERERSIAQGGPAFQGTGGTQVGNEIRASITSRIQDDQKRTALELENAKLIQAQKRATFENVRETEEAGAAWKEYVLATTAVAGAAAAAKNATQAAATAAQDAANTVRDAQAGRIADEGVRLQAELSNAKIVEAQKKAAAESAKGATEAAKANAAYEQAITARVQVEQQITTRNTALAEATAAEIQSTAQARLANAEARAALTPRLEDDRAAIKATRDYYLELAKTLKGSEAEAARSAAIAATGRLKSLNTGDGAELRDQLLQNQASAASLTSRLSDDRQAALALVRFWESQVADAEGLAKARAQGSLTSAKARLESVEQAKVALDEQRIQNRINAARLTADPGDDRAAANALVRFWQKKFNEAEAGADKVSAETKLIAAKLAAKGASGDSGGGGPSTIDILGISQSILRDFAGNLLPTGSAGATGMFALPGIQAGIGAGGGPEQEQVDELRRIRQLIEQRGLGTTVTVSQSFREPDPTGFAQAHFAKFALEEAFNA